LRKKRNILQEQGWKDETTNDVAHKGEM